MYPHPTLWREGGDRKTALLTLAQLEQGWKMTPRFPLSSSLCPRRQRTPTQGRSPGGWGPRLQAGAGLGAENALCAAGASTMKSTAHCPRLADFALPLHRDFHPSSCSVLLLLHTTVAPPRMSGPLSNGIKVQTVGFGTSAEWIFQPFPPNHLSTASSALTLTSPHPSTSFIRQRAGSNTSPVSQSWLQAVFQTKAGGRWHRTASEAGRLQRLGEHFAQPAA